MGVYETEGRSRASRAQLSGKPLGSAVGDMAQHRLVAWTLSLVSILVILVSLPVLTLLGWLAALVSVRTAACPLRDTGLVNCRTV